MLGTTPEDLAQFLHQEERLDSVMRSQVHLNANGPNMPTMCRLIFNLGIPVFHSVRPKWENSSEIMTVSIRR